MSSVSKRLDGPEHQQQSGERRDRSARRRATILAAGPDGSAGGLTNRKYVAMTQVSPETAKRDLAELVAVGVLVRNPGGGRSASYRLADRGRGGDRSGG